MATQSKFEEHHNAQDAFMRTCMVGLLSMLKDRVQWTNRFSHGDRQVTVPFYYSMTGDERFLLDLFVDDAADKRVELGVQTVPRGVLSLKQADIKMDEFTNPNVPLLLNRSVGGLEERVRVPTRPVPMKFTVELSIKVASERDFFVCWQKMVDTCWSYRYFTFEYDRAFCQAVVRKPDGIENTVQRDYQTVGSDDSSITLKLTAEVHTIYPSLDWKRATPARPTDWHAVVYDGGLPLHPSLLPEGDRRVKPKAD